MSFASKTVPISGRIAEEDYAFMMSRTDGGSLTASEKLRQVAHFYRHYHEGVSNYPQAVAEYGRLLERYRLESKGLEHREGIRSELIDRLQTTLPELMALFSSAQLDADGKQGLKQLIRVEERACQLLVDLLESLLRMGLTSQSPTYNPKVVREKLGPIFELLELAKKEKPTT